jgi:hypothetical protein
LDEDHRIKIIAILKKIVKYLIIDKLSSKAFKLYFVKNIEILLSLYTKMNIYNLEYGLLGDRLGEVFEQYIEQVFICDTKDVFTQRIYDSIIKKMKIDDQSIKIEPKILSLERTFNGGLAKTDKCVEINQNLIKMSIKQSCASSVSVSEYDVDTMLKGLNKIDDWILRDILQKYQMSGSAKQLSNQEKISLFQKFEENNGDLRKRLIRWSMSGTSEEYSDDHRYSNLLIFFKMNPNKYSRSNWLSKQSDLPDILGIGIYTIDEYMNEIMCRKAGFGTGLSWTYATGSHGKKIQLKAPVIYESIEKFMNVY